MPTVDAMIARLESELEERNHFVEGLVAGAQDGNRDLNSQEMELIGSARSRITAIGDQLTPLRETSRITIESRNRMHEIDTEMAGPAAPGCRAAHRVPHRQAPTSPRCTTTQFGDESSPPSGTRPATASPPAGRTTDSAALIPESIVSPIVNFIEVARPDPAALGPVDLGSGPLVVHASHAAHAGRQARPQRKPNCRHRR